MNKITIDHFQRMQFLSALVLSPAGQPAWVRTQIENDAYFSCSFSSRRGKETVWQSS